MFSSFDSPNNLKIFLARSKMNAAHRKYAKTSLVHARR
jgi:hypothetical protein